MDKTKEQVIDECIREIAQKSKDPFNTEIAQILIEEPGDELSDTAYQKVLHYSWDRYKIQDEKKNH